VASIRTNKLAHGRESYTLQWREDNEQRGLTFDNKPEADRWKKLLDANGQSFTKAEHLYEEHEVGGITFDELFEEHLNQLTDVGPYQMKRYRSAYRDHFGSLATRTVKGITRSDVTAWINEMRKKPGRYGGPITAKTIANHHGLLSAAMTTAVISGYRADNPCKGVKLPKSTHTEEVIRFMTRAEWDAIMGHMDAHYRPFFHFLVGTGLRFGEATALTARDFDLDGVTPSVKVTKAWKEDEDRGYYIGPPKTKKSRRTVSLAPYTVEVVRPLVEAAGDGYVFKLKRGGCIRSGALYNRAWEPALLKAGYTKTTKAKDGVPGVVGNMPRVHDCRHTSASWLVAAGMEIFALSRRLGHESVTTTMDRYSHLLPDAMFSSSQIAQKALAG
jgi:integrase